MPLIGSLAGNGPPPTVWWSAPEFMPHPCVRLQVSPSSSEYAIALHLPASWLEKVRPVSRSVKRMGSRVRTEVAAKLLFRQATTGGDEQWSGSRRSVSSEAMYMIAPVAW